MVERPTFTQCVLRGWPLKTKLFAVWPFRFARVRPKYGRMILFLTNRCLEYIDSDFERKKRCTHTHNHPENTIHRYIMHHSLQSCTTVPGISLLLRSWALPMCASECACDGVRRVACGGCGGDRGRATRDRSYERTAAHDTQPAGTDGRPRRDAREPGVMWGAADPLVTYGLPRVGDGTTL